MAKDFNGMPAIKFKGHQNTMGKPSNSRGKPPHRGGYHSMVEKQAGRRKIFFTIGGDKDGSPAIPEKKCDSSWSAGKCKPSKRFK